MYIWINEFSEVSGHKINVQLSVAFQYTNNEVSERETKKKIPFINAPNNKVPRNKSTKEVKDYKQSEKYKTWIKETEDDTNQWKATGLE